MAVPVRAVVFDVGGVLLDWDPRYLYRDLIPDPAELEWFLTEVCTMAWNATLDAGRPFDAACAQLAARHPAHAELIHAWRRQDDMVAGEVQGVGEVVAGLRAQGVPLFLLTNMPADIFAARRRSWRILGKFDGAVVSGEEGILKPSPEIFRRLVERFRLDPPACFYVDDVEANVAAARATGFRAHRFVDASALAGALAAEGLAVAPPD